MEEPKVDVGILFAENINFEFQGNYRCPSTSLVEKRCHTAFFSQGKIFYENRLWDELVFEPVSGDTAYFELKDVVIGIHFHWERKENQRFKGGLKLIAEDGKLTAINRIGVEDYLKSVISSEMSATASLELLKAHAIISRSWLLAQMEKNKTLTKASLYCSTFRTDKELVRWYDREDHVRFDVCADDHCQRYQGIIRQNEAVAAAVETTRGMVLEYGGIICDARFSKSCGGVTEKFENCWEPVPHPYLTALRDTPDETDFEDLTDETIAEKWIRSTPPAFCNTDDKMVLSQVLNNYDRETVDFYRWRVSYGRQELSELIARRSGIDFGDVLDLIPLERGTSGRLVRLKIVGSKRTMTIGKELEIRKTLSESHLYSAAFVVDKECDEDGVPSRFTLTGAGWGHGVGLCQIGAAVMGAHGYGYDSILMHYFKSAELVTRY